MERVRMSAGLSLGWLCFFRDSCSSERYGGFDLKVVVAEQERARAVFEVLCKVLCHNICVVIQSMYELGVEPVFWSDEKKVS